MSESDVLASADLERRFGGVARLYGEAGAERLRAAHVAVVGIGGVGSWAAEALARSAVGRITLIDLDHIAESNTNRQIHALGDSYGQSKVEAMAARITAINPACDVRPIDDFVTADNVGQLIGGYDQVLDCIDNVNAKAALIAHARRAGIPVVTCGAAGGRVDPTRIRQGDLGTIAGDPLLAKVRQRLRRDHGFPRDEGARRIAFGVIAIYSDEPVRLPSADCVAHNGELVTGLSCAGYGSSVTVTATMGLVAAAVALNQLVARGDRGA
ncbi:MAG TPA: tRNA threonylcarbamoyladenosine dehydratase [Burkholderiaceae bacterium]|nr:tRNA threonylcarbamoyladenosine dehydratase [Burkholderiaceae bacterium]HQR76240.1 tRNA threonylcarbamoyladenosine dehydratase [Burkholderiaceae bacterium]